MITFKENNMTVKEFMKSKNLSTDDISGVRIETSEGTKYIGRYDLINKRLRSLINKSELTKTDIYKHYMPNFTLYDITVRISGLVDVETFTTETVKLNYGDHSNKFSVTNEG